MLSGTEASICCPNKQARAVLLTRASFCYIERLPDLVCPTHHYPLMPFHVDSKDIAGSNLKTIKKDYQALEAAVKDTRAEVFCLSVLLLKGKGFKRADTIKKING